MIKNTFDAIVALLVAWTFDQHFAAGWCTEVALTALLSLRQSFG
jgi:hypothetical protein